MNYADRYHEIINTPLSPEAINTYASNALGRIALLVSDAASEHRDAVYGVYRDQAHLEEDALHEQGLYGVNVILDHIIDKQTEIDGLDKLISKRKVKVDNIIVPTGQGRILTGSGEGLDDKEVIPRLKTVLFLLQNEFGVDIHSNESVDLTEGVLEGSMVRGESYVMVEVNHQKASEEESKARANLDLHRTILVCDEEGNVTYVLDQAALTEEVISPEDIASYTKSEINELLELFEDKGVIAGERIVYSKKFVKNFNRAMRGDFKPRSSGDGEDTTASQASEGNAEDNTESYLKPEVQVADEGNGIVSAKSLRNELKSGSKTITNIAQELGIDGRECRFGAKTTTGYTPDEAERIREHDYFKLPVADEENGVLSIRQLSVECGTSREVLAEIAHEIGIYSREYRFGSNRTTGYTPDDIVLIKNHPYIVARKGLKNGSYITVGQIRQITDSSPETVVKRADEIGIKLHTAALGQRKITYFTADEFDKILEHPAYESKLKTEEGRLSGINDTASILGTSRKTVIKYAKDLEIEGQELVSRNGSESVGYTLNDIEQLRQRLEENGFYLPDKPEDFMTINEVKKVLYECHDKTLYTLIELCGDELGELTRYKVRDQPTTCFSPEQVSMLLKTGVELGKVCPVAPDGHLTAYGIARMLSEEGRGGSQISVERIIEDYRDDIGSPERMKVGPRKKPSDVYSPQQIEKIFGIMQQEGIITEIAPINFVRKVDIARDNEVPPDMVTRIISDMSDYIGEVRSMSIDNRSTAVYSPEQVKIIQDELHRRESQNQQIVPRLDGQD